MFLTRSPLIVLATATSPRSTTRPDVCAGGGRSAMRARNRKEGTPVVAAGLTAAPRAAGMGRRSQAAQARRRVLSCDPVASCEQRLPVCAPTHRPRCRHRDSRSVHRSAEHAVVPRVLSPDARWDRDGRRRNHLVQSVLSGPRRIRERIRADDNERRLSTRVHRGREPGPRDGART